MLCKNDLQHEKEKIGLERIIALREFEFNSKND